MMDFLLWFTKFENTKPLSLVIFFAVFCGVVIYAYGNQRRGEELETYKNIPLQDDEIQDSNK
jgi:cbb3-type cytochrome oxidase subunit 3